MVEKVIYVSQDRYEETKSFGSDLGYAIFNAAIYNAPKDTGNLRASISLVSNTPNLIHIRYNAFLALYVHYLEQGIGYVTKHKGFIKHRTLPSVVSLIESSLIYDTLPLFSYNPQVSKTFTTKAHGAERAFMRQAGIMDNKLSMSGRRTISKIRMTELRKKHGSSIPARSRGELPVIANRASGEIRQLQSREKGLNAIYRKLRG